MIVQQTSCQTTFRAIEPTDAASMLAEGCIMVDIRNTVDFGRGHVRGAVNIPFVDPQFCGRAEQILPLGATIILFDEDIPDTLHDDTADIEQAAAVLADAGYSHIAGYVDGGLSAWQCAGLPLVAIQPRQATPAGVASMLADALPGTVQLIDVREDWEWEQGHLPGAMHIPLHQLERRLHEIEHCRPVVVYCRSGMRSRSAVVMLEQCGHSMVMNLAGGIELWRRAGFPLSAEAESIEDAEFWLVAA
jgi:hydroxyacylglutathione hydrolase